MLHKKSMLGFIRDLNLVYRNRDSHEKRREGGESREGSVSGDFFTVHENVINLTDSTENG